MTFLFFRNKKLCCQYELKFPLTADYLRVWARNGGKGASQKDTLPLTLTHLSQWIQCSCDGSTALHRDPSHTEASWPECHKESMVKHEGAIELLSMYANEPVLAKLQVQARPTGLIIQY